MTGEANNPRLSGSTNFLLGSRFSLRLMTYQYMTSLMMRRFLLQLVIAVLNIILLLHSQYFVFEISDD